MQQANKRDGIGFFTLEGKKEEEMPFLIPDFPSAIRAPSPLSVRPLAGIIHRCDDTVAPNGDDDRGLSFATHD